MPFMFGLTSSLVQSHSVMADVSGLLENIQRKEINSAMVRKVLAADKRLKAALETYPATKDMHATQVNAKVKECVRSIIRNVK